MKTGTDFSETVKVPESLRQELSAMIDSMDAAEKILSSDRGPAKKALTYIMGVAAGIVLVAGVWMAAVTYSTPEDTFTDPQTAYAEVERALASISEKMNPGLEKAVDAERSLDRSVEIVKRMY